MKFFPKNARTSSKKSAKTSRIKPRLRMLDADYCIDFKKEFNQIIDEKYSDISNENRHILWIKVGSELLNQSPTLSAKARLINALIQAHNQIP
jgi:hypothetical protein